MGVSDVAEPCGPLLGSLASSLSKVGYPRILSRGVTLPNLCFKLTLAVVLRTDVGRQA